MRSGRPGAGLRRRLATAHSRDLSCGIGRFRWSGNQQGFAKRSPMKAV